MFTGLIEDVGTITAVVPQGNGKRLTIRSVLPVPEIKVGDSIAIDGVCLTAETFGSDTFDVVAGTETIRRTSLRDVAPGRKVHLERALRLGDRLDGHLVQGHVDGVGKVLRSYAVSESWVLWIEAPPSCGRYVAEKGSICLDGVSLTVNEVSGPTLRVNIVPHTAEVTLLGAKRPGDPINIEVDVIAKYVERLLGDGHDAGQDLLRKLGWSHGS
jgi:riboflavin synthase